MSDQLREAAQHRESDDVKDWVRACSNLLENHQEALIRSIRAAHALSEEFSNIFRGRILMMAEVWSALAASRSPEDLLGCHRMFATKSMQRCVVELKALSRRTSEV